MSKLYLAARFDRREELRNYAAELTVLGHEVTSRWLFEEHTMSNNPTTEEELQQNRSFANDDLDDIGAADIFVSFTEEKFTDFEEVTDSLAYVNRAMLDKLIGAARGGRHVEYGWAVGCCERVVIVGPRENVFHYLSDVEHFDTWADFVLALKF